MTKDEYDTIPFPEAELVFYRPEKPEGLLYATVVWEEPDPAPRGPTPLSGKFTIRKGIKFQITEEAVKQIEKILKSK